MVGVANAVEGVASWSLLLVLQCVWQALANVGCRCQTTCVCLPSAVRFLGFHAPCLTSTQGFTNPDSFDPDRFSPERKEDITYQRNFLTFGCGPHYCVGREYAINHLTVFLAILSTSCEWTRRRTDKSDTWLYLPTIYPADSFITLKSQ